MVVTPSTASITASAVLRLSKAAWKLGSSLSKLDQNTDVVDTLVRDLAGDVKSLGNECDLVFAELEELSSKNETGSSLLYDIDSRLWNCLAGLVEEIGPIIQELELFVQSSRVEEFSLQGQAQRQRKRNRSRDHIASIRTKLSRQIENLRTTVLMFNTLLTYIMPRRFDGGLTKNLDKLQNMIEKLQRALEVNPLLRSPHVEATLVQCAREVIVKGTDLYEASMATGSITGIQGAAPSHIRVAEWVKALESIRWDRRHSDLSDTLLNTPSVFSEDEGRTVTTVSTSMHRNEQAGEVIAAPGDDSEDDLDVDLAKAALATGTNAFEAQSWEEADSLFQEALRVLQQLPKQQRAFCDLFGLHHKLAVCAYHTQESSDAEQALLSLVQQLVSNDEQRAYIYDATHLLSHLYIRMGQVERARSQCEKALQGRRRLLGKRSDASLESTALMAQIYVLLNNRARAKSYLSMIPDERRDAVLKVVEDSLGTKVTQLDASSSPLTRSISGDSDLAAEGIESRLSKSSLTLPVRDRLYSPKSAVAPQSPPASSQRSHQRTLSSNSGPGYRHSVTVTSLSSEDRRNESRATEKARTKEDYAEHPEVVGTPNGRILSRKEILDNVGCQPKDGIEDAVCEGKHLDFTNLLNSKKRSWRSKLHKRGRAERVTALHFAALFGELDMARRLLDSDFNINEVPYGYSTNLTPLKFAIGARQVAMVEFLTANGARPSEPDSWSLLAGQLMNRSWLAKTMSEGEKEDVPNRMIEILRILLKRGWDVNAPFEASGRTVLHQAVTFWTGSYRWDLKLRFVITSFLCERGANPFQADTEGKTPYDMALASGHQDLVSILGQGASKERSAEPIELPV